MKYYKDASGRVFAYESDGSQDHVIPADQVEITEAEADALRAPMMSANDQIRLQIVELEVQVTDRRIREAVLGIDNDWLKNLNDQICALREQLA